MVSGLGPDTIAHYASPLGYQMICGYNERGTQGRIMQH